MTSVLSDVLAAMDAIDAEYSRENLRNIGESGPFQASMKTGMDILQVVCDAYALDPDEVLRVANERGKKQVGAALMFLGAPFSLRMVDTMTGMTVGGILTGLRIGLMVADARAREAGR